MNAVLLCVDAEGIVECWADIITKERRARHMISNTYVDRPGSYPEKVTPPGYMTTRSERLSFVHMEAIIICS